MTPGKLPSFVLITLAKRFLVSFPKIHVFLRTFYSLGLALGLSLGSGLRGHTTPKIPFEGSVELEFNSEDPRVVFGSWIYCGKEKGNTT